MSPDRHHRNKDTEEEGFFWDAPSSPLDEASAHEHVPMLRCDREAIDHDADFWEAAATDTPFLTLRHVAATSSLRANIADALFFSLMGAVVAYAMLLASGTLYRGKPDMADAMRWRMWRDGRMAFVDAQSQKDERRDMGGDPMARVATYCWKYSDICVTSHPNSM